MKTKYFLKKHDACKNGAKWALSISDDIADVWDAMIEHEKHNWLLWTATRPGVFSDSTLRKLACRFVRETPLVDGLKVWDLLGDERSRIAIEVAELFADGKATETEMAAAAAAAAAYAYDAAYAARVAAYAAARAAAYDADADAAAYTAAAARAAAYAAARDAAYTAAYAAYADAYDAAADDAKAAQARMIAELGNPFKERAEQ
jgi:hypothetical protein